MDLERAFAGLEYVPSVGNENCQSYPKAKSLLVISVDMVPSVADRMPVVFYNVRKDGHKHSARGRVCSFCDFICLLLFKVNAGYGSSVRTDLPFAQG